ncbi:unnamed protein product [Paramecium sonneborni]|uniref:Uncharacterized protein n=1 Tax=Paramecium sonneborni TaxID=65129 RepID=A0A8S1PK68_9CILI|nr:unnamed protein product [Paramecium sonneborni]
MSKLDQKLKESLREINFSVDANPNSNSSIIIEQNNALTNIHLDIYCQIELLTYVCAGQNYYFQDIVDQQKDLQQNQVDNLNKIDGYYNNNEQKSQKNQDQNYSEEKRFIQNNEKYDLSTNLNNQQNQLD